MGLLWARAEGKGAEIWSGRRWSHVLLLHQFRLAKFSFPQPGHFQAPGSRRRSSFSGLLGDGSMVGCGDTTFDGSSRCCCCLLRFMIDFSFSFAFFFLSTRIMSLRSNIRCSSSVRCRLTARRRIASSERGMVDVKDIRHKQETAGSFFCLCGLVLLVVGWRRQGVGWWIAHRHSCRPDGWKGDNDNVRHASGYREEDENHHVIEKTKQRVARMRCSRHSLAFAT